MHEPKKKKKKEGKWRETKQTPKTVSTKQRTNTKTDGTSCGVAQSYTDSSLVATQYWLGASQ